mmetsp:Transcript_3126/g.5136  ORF Transcript_3126/g.5136 Transcript_3126/m.5136 type:complete len:140 (+) Transcript_3126:476-895(+)
MPLFHWNVEPQSTTEESLAVESFGEVGTSGEVTGDLTGGTGLGVVGLGVGGLFGATIGLGVGLGVGGLVGATIGLGVGLGVGDVSGTLVGLGSSSHPSMPSSVKSSQLRSAFDGMLVSSFFTSGRNTGQVNPLPMHPST